MGRSIPTNRLWLAFSGSSEEEEVKVQKEAKEDSRESSPTASGENASWRRRAREALPAGFFTAFGFGGMSVPQGI